MGELEFYLQKLYNKHETRQKPILAHEKTNEEEEKSSMK
jgi:hypothetical protein